MSLYRTLVGGAVVLILFGWFFVTRPTPEVSPEIEVVPPAPSAPVEPVSHEAAPSPVTADRERAPQSVAKTWTEKPFAFQKDLEDFSQLRAKVLRVEDEEREFKRFLSDPSLLRAAALRLTEASLAPGVLSSQDAAVDLLIEALKSGDKDLASDMAKAIVEDPQIESPTLDPEVRTNLAGIKAEVLYHWTALVPEAAKGLENSLPGPVSRKIWANVNRRQLSNQAEEAPPVAN